MQEEVLGGGSVVQSLTSVAVWFFVRFLLRIASEASGEVYFAR